MVCVRETPGNAIKIIARALNWGSAEYTPSLEVVIWSSLFGQDEEEISSKLGIPLGKVREYGDNLRRNGLWDDGMLVLDPAVDVDDYGERSVMMVMYSLVAEGLVKRAVDGAAAPVDEDGGTDQDGKQESDGRQDSTGPGG